MSFQRRLTLFDATMIVISGIIGSGIFINPYIVAQLVTTPFLILAVWVVGGLIALAGAFVFAELSTVLPRVGGQYAFFREAFHPLVAFLHGWSLLFIIQSGATAGVAVAFAKYLVPLLGLPTERATPLAVAILIGLAGFHALGIKPGAILINLITFGKTVAIVVLVAGAFLLTERSGLVSGPPVPPHLAGGGLVSAFFAGLVPVMFSYGGWQNLSFVAEEVRDPLRNLPRAILIGVLCVIVVYVGANIAYLHVLSAPALAATETPAADMAGQLFGPTGAQLISLLIVVSTFGFMNLALLSAPRVYYAMGADRVFFAALGQLSPRFHVPTAAILLQGGLAAIFAISNRYDELVGYAVFADWIFFALAGLALIVFRRTLPEAPRPRPVPFYPLTPILFALAGLGIVLNTFITDWENARMGAAIIIIGIPVFFWWRRSGRHGGAADLE
ncbi:MAG: APC family permease [Blastocatellia bacterium]|jgi:basic amino acid/polyamine antiporter, APA family